MAVMVVRKNAVCRFTGTVAVASAGVARRTPAVRSCCARGARLPRPRYANISPRSGRRTHTVGDATRTVGDATRTVHRLYAYSPGTVRFAVGDCTACIGDCTGTTRVPYGPLNLTLRVQSGDSARDTRDRERGVGPPYAWHPACCVYGPPTVGVATHDRTRRWSVRTGARSEMQIRTGR
jgi:hypothetical protein